MVGMCAVFVYYPRFSGKKAEQRAKNTATAIIPNTMIAVVLFLIVNFLDCEPTSRFMIETKEGQFYENQ
jgi:hypothetical protein